MRTELVHSAPQIDVVKYPRSESINESVTATHSAKLGPKLKLKVKVMHLSTTPLLHAGVKYGVMHC